MAADSSVAGRTPAGDQDATATAGSDLSHSLKHEITLSAASGSPESKALVADPTRRAVNKSPSLQQLSRPISVLRGPSSTTVDGHDTPSRSSTPGLSRKSSMNSLPTSRRNAPSRRASSAARSPVVERASYTPNSVASAHFAKELEAHHGESKADRETIVILHDLCYGHRFSRPRTSRLSLSTIVERPERIKACALGISAAYVRLGGRHQDGIYPIDPDRDAAALPFVPFRIHKSTRRVPLTSQAVTNVHGVKWMEELKVMCDSAETKLTANGKELRRPDMDRGPGAEATEELHQGDLYLCAESLEAIEGSLGGVCDAVDAVLQPQGPRRAFVAIRPPGHHCSMSYPSGFCWVNNVHVGIMHAILSHGLTHAAIIDFDLHHGDGSQSIAWQHNRRSVALPRNAPLWKKSSIGYFSLHDINSYPCEMGEEDKVSKASICIENAHGQNIWNVHLQPWRTEAEFWALYDARYSTLLEKSRTYLEAQTERTWASGLKPKAAIFLSAGFDASEWEGVGMQRHNVKVPTEFYARLTRDVVRLAAAEGTSVQGRVISVLEGGYSDRALCSGIMSHLSGLAGDGSEEGKGKMTDGHVSVKATNKPSSSRLGGLSETVEGGNEWTASERERRCYDPSWWSVRELETLEAAMAAKVAVPPKVERNAPLPTYCSPTQASTARMVDKARRSVSATFTGSPVAVSRPATPLPPEVPWAVAAVELSKLLVPSHRQTDSCKHEDLNADATRARRNRQSFVSQVTSGVQPGVQPDRQSDRPATRMSRRARKPDMSNNGAQDNVLPPRPETSMSVQAGTETDGRTTAAMGKKARGPTKKEPVPRQPRAPKQATVKPRSGSRAPSRAPSAGSIAPDSRSVSTEPVAGPVVPLEKTLIKPDLDKGGYAMNSLTDGIKNIKITTVTNARREAREWERQEEREGEAAGQEQVLDAQANAPGIKAVVQQKPKSPRQVKPSSARLSHAEVMAASNQPPSDTTTLSPISILPRHPSTPRT